MSFISILKTIETDVIGVVRIAEPIVEAIVPASLPIFSIFDKLTNAVKTAEVGMPNATGDAKALAVVNDFQDALALTQQILATNGQQLTYDAVAVQKAVNDQVTVFNDFATIMASFKVTAVVPKV